MKPLRQGRFKKQLLDPAGLSAEAPEVARRLAPLAPFISDPALYASLWCLQYLRTRYPRNWWGSKRPHLLHAHKLNVSLAELDLDWQDFEHPLLEEHVTLGNLWGDRAFKATPVAVHRSLLAWSAGAYPLVLMDRVPTVEEVLAQQTRGQRCVTLMRRPSALAKLVLGERDALGFAFHDLIHADHFFHDNHLMRAQVGFYRLVERMLTEGMLAPFMARAEFPEALDYLLADMNAHPVHLLKCLRAICRKAHDRESGELFERILPQYWPSETHESLRELNGPRFTDAHARALTDWCWHQGAQVNSP
jgi:hypothetical protein